MKQTDCIQKKNKTQFVRLHFRPLSKTMSEAFRKASPSEKSTMKALESSLKTFLSDVQTFLFANISQNC